MVKREVLIGNRKSGIGNRESGRTRESCIGVYGLAIDLFAVPDPQYPYSSGSVGDVANQQIVADPVFPVFAKAPLERFADAARILVGFEAAAEVLGEADLDGPVKLGELALSLNA
jgi:hypothetical protein